MLTVYVPGEEYFDNKTQEFVETEGMTLELEHSLSSLSLWESKWEKPFLGRGEKTTEETLDYVRAMTLTPNVPPEVYSKLPNSVLEQINDYIKAPMTATTFNRLSQDRPSNEVITAEVIYYWLVALNIPFEVQDWHLNRLLTLVQVVNIKSQPKKKMSRGDRQSMLSQRAALNAARRQEQGTTG